MVDILEVGSATEGVTAIAGAVIIAGVAYVLYKYMKSIGSNTQVAYDVATSNPVSKTGSTWAISSNIKSANPDYANAQVVYTDTPVMNNQQQIDVTPSGIGTNNPLPAGTPTGSTLGSLANPYNYNDGFQGTGFYYDIPPYPSRNVTMFISGLSIYLNPSSDPTNYPY